MTQKRSLMFIVIAILFAILAAISVTAIFSAKDYADSGSLQKVAAASSVSFYDVKAAPIFYGATKITITKDAVSEFSTKDSRFRVFAKDYEDGDVTPNIVCEYNNVNPTASGNYEVRYLVKDKHGNKSELTVPVTVLDESGGRFVVERTVYAVPKMENLSFVGTERCNRGDRQILGIYVPKDASFKARNLSTNVENDFQITFFTNTRRQNSFSAISKSPNVYSEIKNINGGVSYAAVPLITSPRLKEEKADVTYKIELSYDSNVKPLDYYHYKDDEQAFITEWKNSKTEFGVVDGEAMLVVVPFGDVDKLSNYKEVGYNAPFESLNAFFEYYLEVVNRMDEAIGLSFNPTSWLDRNYRTKYTCVADSAMAGIGAYYEETFIAVASNTAAPFFQYGWGTLHEIAHGYQGFLGRGNTKGLNLGLNETGNNVLAYYVQNDRSLYKGVDNWLGGTLKEVEESKNALCLSGAEVFVTGASAYVNTSEKLYALVNLFNAFEGAKTYGKLFSYYRATAYEKGVNAFTVPDVYAKFFAEEYRANVVPYLKAWKLAISDEVDMEVFSKELTPFVIPDDIVGKDGATNMAQSGKIDLIYGAVKEADLKLNDEVDLTVNFNIDDFSVINGRKIGLYKDGKLVKAVSIDGKTMKIKNLKVGVYGILVPAFIDYDVKNPSFVLKTDAENRLEIDYRKVETGKIFHPTKLRLMGIRGTEGFSLEFKENNTKATASLGAADMGNQNSYWKSRPDEVFASVTVLNNDGKTVAEYAIKGNGYFLHLTGLETELDVEYGYRVKVFTHKPENVGVWSIYIDKEKPKEIARYKTTEQTTIYEITKNGLKKLGEEFDVEQVLGEAIKDELLKRLDDYAKNTSESDVKNLRVQKDIKREILSVYDMLSETDKNEYKEFFRKIKYGRAPKIVTKADRIVIKKGEKIDLRSLISITDAEDIVIDSSAASVETKLNTDKIGTYSVNYSVSDYDKNNATATIEIVVEGTLSGGKIAGIAVGVLAAVGVVTAAVVVAIKKKRGQKANKN